MRKKFTLKKSIILLSITLVYSAALCYISVLAKKSILNDLVYTSDSVSAFSKTEAVDKSPTEVEIDIPMYYEGLERLDDKAELNSYDILLPVTTEVTEIDSIPSDTKVAENVTTVPSSEKEVTAAEPTKPTTEKTTVSTTEPTKATTQKTTKTKSDETTKADTDDVDIDDTPQTDDVNIDDEPSSNDDSDDDVEVNEDSNVELDEDGPNVTMTTDPDPNIFDEQYIQSILDEFYNNTSPEIPGSFGDILYSGKSYADDIVTIYDKNSGRYITDNAFDIVCGVTFNEVGSSMHDEAIKAQAVAVYTYIKYYQQKGEYASLTKKSDVPQKVIDCVRAVDGLAMFYDGEYILASFSASTAGVTCASENVWGGYRPYLVSVDSSFDHLDEKNYGRVTTYTADEIRRKIESKTDIRLSDNCEEWIRILSYADGSYVDKISIDGHTSAVVSGKERELTAYVLRTYILSIRSTCFTVSYRDGTFTFVTYGYGHGVGMSQNGANLYAQYGGYTFDQILHHYYTGITIQ